MSETTNWLQSTQQKSEQPLAMDDPDRIGPYHVISILGHGGFGVVYLAERREPMVQRVALKVLKPGMDSKGVIARFEQERQALAVMNHPNVARVFDAGTTSQGRPYFVMEYVRGESITAYCDRHRLTLRRRLELMIPVCEAVQHAHMKGIIHRDLKPSNVLVAEHDDKPAPKVIDFGVAKAVSHGFSDNTIFTEHGQLIGTPEYMSPEQADFGATDIDTRTDVYSLGVLLYELLTGTLPFDWKSLKVDGFGAIQRAIREMEPHRPSTRVSLHSADDKGTALAQRRGAEPKALGRQLKGDCDWIIMKCLEKDRSRRYLSIGALSADLERHLRNEPVLAGPPGLAYRSRKWIGRHRGKVAAGLVALVGIPSIIMLSLLTLQWQASERQARAELNLLQQRREEREAFEIVESQPRLGELDFIRARSMLERLQNRIVEGPPAAEDVRLLVESVLRTTLVTLENVNQQTVAVGVSIDRSEVLCGWRSSPSDTDGHGDRRTADLALIVVPQLHLRGPTDSQFSDGAVYLRLSEAELGEVLIDGGELDEAGSYRLEGTLECQLMRIPSVLPLWAQPYRADQAGLPVGAAVSVAVKGQTCALAAAQAPEVMDAQASSSTPAASKFRRTDRPKSEFDAGRPRQPVVIPAWASMTLTAEGAGTDPAIETPQGRLKSMRVAELDAKRKLAEFVNALPTPFSATVGELMVQDDSTRSRVQAVLAESIADAPSTSDGVTTVRVSVECAAIWRVIHRKLARANQD